jgi:hypothetical protein
VMRLLVLWVCLLIGVSSISAAGDRRDGDWWLKLDPAEHQPYLIGVMDGVQATLWHAMKGMDQPSYETLSDDVVASLTGITSADLARNLTEFYREHPEWRNIRISAAIWLVSLRIHGATDAQLSRDVDMIREHTKN